MLIIIHGAGGLRLHNSVLDGNASSKAVFVHIPKTAGTALTETLHALSDMTGVVAHSCGCSQHALQSCLPLTEQAFQVMSGEFVSTEFLELLKEVPSETTIWTMLRNPILRTLSQIERHNRHGRISEADVHKFLLGGSCPWDINKFCNTLTNPKKCLDDPCNIFSNHQSAVLGFATSGLDNEVAEERLQAQIIRVGITEFYKASVCLFLHEHQDMSDGMADVISNCCLHDDDSKCTLLNKASSHHSTSDYWDLYLQNPEYRQTLVRHTQKDCDLYQRGLNIFDKDVRSLEAKWKVALLPASIDLMHWSCESWLKDYVDEASQKSLVYLELDFDKWDDEDAKHLL